MDRIGRYEIVKELGRGAMGVVFHAVDPSIGRPVAIKTIRLSELSHPEERAKLKERLFREARSAGILSHPGIITIYNMEEIGDLAYIAMEFVDGPTLEQLLASEKPIDPETMLRVLRQTAEALDYAHVKGIVHRDIKPANIMLDGGQRAKIADFGIAKMSASNQFTMAGTILGTPNYMSPEQVQGLGIDGRADQYSLAVIAYEMLTGERPYSGEHLTTLVYKIVSEEPPPAHRLNPTLGLRIEHVLRRGLAKKPETRYGSCAEFVRALESACVETPGWKSLPRGGSGTFPTMPGVPALLPGPSPLVAAPPPERKVWPFVAALLLVLSAVGIVAWQAGLISLPVQKVTPPPVTAAPPPPVEEKKPSPMEETPASPAADIPKPAEETPANTKPANSPENFPTTTPATRPAAPTPTASPNKSEVYQDIWVTTDPPGATATLDGRAESKCRTPCILPAAAGSHTISVLLSGFQEERRDVTVADRPLDLPRIALRPTGGTLMLSTTPPGASVTIDGHALTQKTPARIDLTVGAHTLTVEKDGRNVSERIEIRSGVTNVLKIPIPQ